MKKNIVFAILIISCHIVNAQTTEYYSGNSNSYYNNPYGDGLLSNNSNLLPTYQPKPEQSMNDYSVVSSNMQESYNNISNNY